VLKEWNPLPVGAVMGGTTILIRGEDGRAMPEGERGEIVIAGPNVSPGYLGRPDLTERAFFELEGERAYRTGDWGRQRDGLIFFEGRMDNQVKVSGYRIELGDLEANLRALPGIADAVVLPVGEGNRVDSLAAFVIQTADEGGSDFERAARLKTALAQRLPAYMIPRKFHFVESFPMTANGKADRRALAARLKEPRARE
jgi:D-alanine--poly(phosphoribitol) ligase subunit 1